VKNHLRERGCDVLPAEDARVYLKFGELCEAGPRVLAAQNTFTRKLIKDYNATLSSGF